MSNQNRQQNAQVELWLGDLEDLPQGESIHLAGIGQPMDGGGGLVVKRHSRHTWVFQREHHQQRSRWADSIQECEEELRFYIQTGALHPPDKVIGF